jgi:hypothetical protein
VVSSP